MNSSLTLRKNYTVYENDNNSFKEPINKKLKYEYEIKQDFQKNKIQNIIPAISSFEKIPEKRDIENLPIALLKDTIKKEMDEKFILLKNQNFGSNRNQFLLSLHPGLEFLVPPYDIEWSTGAMPADKNTGKFGAYSTGNAYAAGGIGVFLSSEDKVITHLSALAQVDYLWNNPIFFNGYAYSEGEVGVLVYETGSGTIIKDVRKQLFSFSEWQRQDIGGIKGADSLQLNDSPLQNVYFQMEAGSEYLVWIWCNVTTHMEGGGWANGQIDCSVPLIIVDSSPAPVIR